jgi:serine/threonine protein kinase, bacterial
MGGITPGWIIFMMVLFVLIAVAQVWQHLPRKGVAASLKTNHHLSPALSPEHASTERLLQHYRFVQLLAETRFGKTYVAEDTLARPKSLWVIKHFVPQPQQNTDLETTQRLFKGEAKALEKLKRLDVIPQLLQYVEREQEVWFIREYIIGHPLNEELIPGKPVSELQVIELLREILQGLAAIHQFQIIHRDIKPSNIIRRKQDRRLILIDFGAAKEWDPEQVPTPMMTVAIGTAGYTAYEQMMGQPLPPVTFILLG